MASILAIIGQAALADCHPRLAGAFADALGEAGRTGNYLLLKEKFGRAYEELVGLPCDPEELQAILETKGWEKFGIRETLGKASEGQVISLTMRRRRGGFLGLIFKGDSGSAQMIFKDGKTKRFNIGPIT